MPAGKALLINIILVEELFIPSGFIHFMFNFDSARSDLLTEYIPEGSLENFMHYLPNRPLKI
jgi:hypothetical protein